MLNRCSRLEFINIVIETDQLSKSYGSTNVLDRCTMSVRRGEIFGLLAPNGSGKSTLIRILLGFLRPTAGSAHILAIDCHRQSKAVHEQTSYLPGDARLFARMTGRQSLDFFSKLHPAGDRSRAEAIARRLDIDLSRPIAQCSTGMRQKLALAIALAPATPIVVLDEPTSNLDPTVQSEVLALLDEARREGRTILLSSHILSEIEAICDRVGILKAGRLVHVQEMSAMRQQHWITAVTIGPAPTLPAELAELATNHATGDQSLQLRVDGKLTPVLAWLATLPVEELRIEPARLRGIYDQYHGRGANGASA